MVIFNSYVKLPEGIGNYRELQIASGSLGSVVLPCRLPGLLEHAPRKLPIKMQQSGASKNGGTHFQPQQVILKQETQLGSPER